MGPMLTDGKGQGGKTAMLLLRHISCSALPSHPLLIHPRPHEAKQDTDAPTSRPQRPITGSPSASHPARFHQPQHCHKSYETTATKDVYIPFSRCSQTSHLTGRIATNVCVFITLHDKLNTGRAGTLAPR